MNRVVEVAVSTSQWVSILGCKAVWKERGVPLGREGRKEVLLVSYLGNEIAFDSDIHGSLMRQVQRQDISKPLNFVHNSICVWHFSSVLGSWEVWSDHLIYLFLDFFWKEHMDHTCIVQLPLSSARNTGIRRTGFLFSPASVQGKGTWGEESHWAPSFHLLWISGYFIMSRRPQRKVVAVVSMPAMNRFLTTSVKFTSSKNVLSFPFSWKIKTIIQSSG